MKIALTKDELRTFTDFLSRFEDAEQISNNEYVLDLFESDPPMTMDLTLEKDGLRIEGAAALRFDEEMDGWYAAERTEDAEKIRRILIDSGALNA